MSVAHIMTKDVFTCQWDDCLSVPAQLMWDHDCGCVPVVDHDGRPIGMVTDRDICMAAYTTGQALGNLRVAGAMSSSIYTCKPGDSIADVEGVMRSQQIRRVPVVDDGRIVGIVSLNDLALEATAKAGRGKKRAVTLAEVGEALASTCTRRATRPAEVASAA